MKKPSAKSLDKKLLLDWKIKIKNKDNFTCQLCGKYNPMNHPHHILPRHIKQTRYDLNNGIVLCFYCHTRSPFAAHQNALFFADWLRTNRKWQYDYLMNKINEIRLNDKS